MAKLEIGNSKNLFDSKIVFVVPTLDEEEGVGLVLDGINKVMHQNNHIVLVVDGHSEDRTIPIAKDRGAHILFQRENGYGDALMTGFNFACEELNADVIVMMDADGTYDPNDIPKLLNPILEKRADLVIGNRFSGMKQGCMPFVNRIGNRVLSWIVKRTLGIKINDTQCGIRALRVELIKHVTMKTKGMPFATEMLAEAKQVNARIVEVPVAYHQRIGNTKLNPTKDGIRIVGTIFRLIKDYNPLILFGGSGVLLTLTGFFLAVNPIFEWVQTGSIEHLTSFSLGSTLFATGIITLIVGLLADMIKDLRKEVRSKLS